MEIVRLSDRPDCLDLVASWIWNEWERDSSTSVDQIRDRIKPECRPPPLLAIVSGEPCGALLFRRVNYRGREPLRLYLDSLFVI